jgi:spermidine synthase
LTRRALFLGLYTASGAAALLYEVAWTRLLTLQMGHTVAAASTVLAAFMGGLAVGASIAGRIPAQSPTIRLRAYATLELAIGLMALALPALLATSVPALRWAYADGAAPVRFGLVRVAVCLGLLGLPAAAMGATFPLAAGWFARKAEKGSAARIAASDAGALYAANTAGAAAGALGAGFWLIPAIGLRGTTWAGVALNALVATGALWLAHQSGREAGQGAPSPPRPAASRQLTAGERPEAAPADVRLAWAAVAVSGFAALAYEVAWTRLLALVIGPTTYAFATMVASFITGLAIGSAAGARLARRSTQPVRWLAAMLVLTGAAGSAAAWFAASRLPLVVAAEVAGPSAAFGPIVFRQALLVGLLLLPMTSALGAAFPLALAVAAPGRSTIERDTARVYAFNTLGAVSGALTGGFVLLPVLGLHNTFRALAVVGLVSSVAVWAGRRRKFGGKFSGALLGLAAAGMAFAVPAWDRDLLTSGAYKYAPYVQSADLEMTLRAGRLEYYRDGAASTVSARRLAGTLSLAIDGKIDASNAGDMLTQRLLGLLPLLLHRDAQDICIIGLGSGVTLGSALAAGTVHHADVVEISPEVVEASSLFEKENGHALTAPGVRLIIGDGRSHLLLTTRTYDVIVSEPSNPWMAGVAALFTREFFAAARAKLRYDGLFCQWAHTYDISGEDLRSIVRTFASVFPQGTMWLVGAGDLLLIGTTGPAIEPFVDNVERRLASTSRTLSDVAIVPATAPFALLSLYAGGPRDLERYADAAAIQTDDRMALEFSAPRGIYGRSKNDNRSAIQSLADAASRPRAVKAVFESATSESWAARGAMELRAEAFDSAYADLRRAVTLNARSVTALGHLSEAAAGAARQDEERAWLQSLAESQPGNAAVRVELSRVLASSGDFKGAAAAAVAAMQNAPADPRAAEQLASVFADAGDVDRLSALADELLARFPGRDEPRFYHATALFLKGHAGEAADEALRLVTANPGHARAQSLLGAACATAARHDCARSAFEAALQANPRDPSTYVNAGVFLLQSGDPTGAADYFAEALTLDPASTAAREGLAQSRAATAKP